MKDRNKIAELLLYMTLLLLPFIYIFLFLKGFYSFKTATIIYAANIIILTPLLIRDGKRKKNLGFWVFYLIIIYFIAFLPWGLDMTDEIYNLTLTHFFPSLKNFLSESCSFSLLIAKYWVSLTGKPFILWARLGKITVLASIVFLSLKTLELYDNKLTNNWLASLIIFTISGIISIFISLALTPYDNIPVLLLILFAYLALRGLKHNSLIYNFLAGIIFVFAIYSRITLFFLLPLLVISFMLKTFRQIKLWLYFAAGLLAGLIIIKLLGLDLLYFLHSFSALRSQQPTYNSVCIIGDNVHTFSYIIKTTLRHLRVTAMALAFPTLGIFSVQYLFTKKTVLINSSFKKFLILLILIISFLPELYFKAGFFKFVGVYSALILLILIIDYKTYFKNWELSLSLVFIAIGAFAGSNTGLFKLQSNFAITFILPIIIGLSYQKINKHLLFTAIIYLGLLSLIYKTTHIHRDVNIREQNYIAQNRIFRGISTKKSKIYELESFTHSLKNILPAKKYIAINRSFVISLLTDKEPQSLCWFTDSAKLEQAIRQGQIKYIIFTRHNLANPYWKPDTTMSYRQTIMKKILPLLSENCKSVLQSPNGIFVLMKANNKEEPPAN